MGQKLSVFVLMLLTCFLSPVSSYAYFFEEEYPDDVGFCSYDDDFDGICDDTDLCYGFDNTDSDGDGTCDDYDDCDDSLDTDSDGTPDCYDYCAGDDASGDADFDGICDSSDVCYGFSNTDVDSDGTCDDYDDCNENLDGDGDGTPDCYDYCSGDDASGDSDYDGICDGSDVCYGFSNTDSDSDGTCDDWDDCNDNQDTDGDGNPDCYDFCLGDDFIGDSDYDGICDDRDICEGFDNIDTDQDGICDDYDDCDDSADQDQDGVPDCFDMCSGDDLAGDSDGDGICDNADTCAGFSNTDVDGDGICDDNDDCDNSLDSDGDGIPDCEDACDGNDFAGDLDADGVCDDIDYCDGAENIDSDADGICDEIDACDNNIDDNFNGIPDCEESNVCDAAGLSCEEDDQNQTIDEIEDILCSNADDPESMAFCDEELDDNTEEDLGTCGDMEDVVEQASCVLEENTEETMEEETVEEEEVCDTSVLDKLNSINEVRLDELKEEQKEYNKLMKSWLKRVNEWIELHEKQGGISPEDLQKMRDVSNAMETRINRVDTAIANAERIKEFLDDIEQAIEDGNAPCPTEDGIKVVNILIDAANVNVSDHLVTMDGELQMYCLYMANRDNKPGKNVEDWCPGIEFPPFVLE